MKQHYRIVRLFLSLILLALASVSFALDVPPLQAPVTDRAHLFSNTELQELNAYLSAIHEKSDVQIAVLTIPSLEGEAIEDYSIRVADAWQIGKKGKDSGVIVVIAAADRKVRIEVGYGLEGVLTDAKTNRIIRSVLLPAFQNKEYGQGTLQGVKHIAAEVLQDENLVDTTEEKQEDDDPLPLIIVCIVIFLVGSRFMPGGWLWPLLFLFSGRRGGFGGRSGGSGRGGGFSGGGGKFGGGGSSGSW